MEQKNAIVLRELLSKKPFTRVMPDGHYDHGYRLTEITEEAPITDSIKRKIVTQEDFLRELDPAGHLINDEEYYPNVWKKGEDGLWYMEEVPRYAFAYQQIILHKQLTHLTGNDIQFELATKNTDDSTDVVFNTFKNGWASKNMEVAWYQFSKSVKATGDAAFVGYMKDGKFGWRVFSFLNGDKLYPHYDKETGELDCLARTYSSYGEDGSVIKKYVDVWDKTNYYRFSMDGGENGIMQKIKSAVLSLFNLSGYKLEAMHPHGFEDIPCSYYRDDMGPCWTYSQDTADNYESAFSRLAQNNHSFGLPIMYVKGEGSQTVSTKDMTYACKIMFLPSDGEVGFLNRQDASSAYNSELAMLESKIYKQSFVVATPEVKSGDMPAAAIKLLYSDSYEKAMADANDFDPAVDKIVDIFSYGYGTEMEMRLKFINTPISHYIKPYVHLNETELTTNLATAVQNKFLSRQTASEKCTYSIPGEWNRIRQEEHDNQMDEVLLQQQRQDIQTEASIQIQKFQAELAEEQQEKEQQRQATEITGEQSTEQATASDNGGNQASTKKRTHGSAGGSVVLNNKGGRPNRTGRSYDSNGNWQGRNGWDSWNETH